MLKWILIFCWFGVISSQDDRFALNLLHYNDFHARFVETSPGGTVCNPEVAPCIGGFARLATAVREGLQKEPQSLLLNGGDSFQGTIWYNLLRWNVTKEFMNMLPHDAHVLGNHEFDNGVEGAVPYLYYLNDPVVTANMIDDDEPTIQGLYNKSIIIQREGRKIGIIGVLISTTNTLASTGRLRFTNEVEAVREEAEKLNEQGVKIIIVLSHCGLDIDRDIALNGGPYIDIIVGGHSHTLLYNGEPPENSGFTPLGAYPVVVEQEQRPVLIVQAAAHTQYLGEIKLFFDDDGILLDWEGNPHFLGNEVEQATDVLDKIAEYLPIIEEQALQEVGSSMVQLSANCRCNECNLGSFICDAFMNAVMDMAEGVNWHYAHFCVINQGGIRTAIDSGVITFESVFLSTPFENNVEVFELRGDHIMEMLEFSVSNTPYGGAGMLQVSGLQTVFDGARPAYDRVVNASVRCIECDIPRYEPLKLDKYYRVVSQSFLGGGGDGFSACISMFPATTVVEAMLVYPSLLLNEGFGIKSIRLIFDGSLPIGSRVVNVTVRCIDCVMPRYEPLLVDKYYRVVSTDFLANGGGDFTMISENRRNVQVVGLDYKILMDYIRHQTPVFADVDGRIQISDACNV